MSMEVRYVLVMKDGGEDVIHRNPREECNLDDAKRREDVDPDTADALVSLEGPGAARRCEHCYKEDRA